MHRLALQRRGGLAAQERSGQGRSGQGRRAEERNAQGRRLQERRAQGPVASVQVPLRRFQGLEAGEDYEGAETQRRIRPEKALQRATSHTLSFSRDSTPQHLGAPWQIVSAIVKTSLSSH